MSWKLVKKKKTANEMGKANEMGNKEWQTEKQEENRKCIQSICA